MRAEPEARRAGAQSPRRLVLVLVGFLDALLVDVRMSVRLAVVRVLVLVLDVPVLVRRVCVHVRLAAVLVRVGVRDLVGGSPLMALLTWVDGSMAGQAEAAQGLPRSGARCGTAPGREYCHVSVIQAVDRLRPGADPDHEI